MRGHYVVLMLVEALAYSLVLGLAINIILEFIFSAIPSSILGQVPLAGVLPAPGGMLPTLGLQMGFGNAGLTQGLALSLGAGLFEEFIFRVILLGTLLLGTRAILPHHPATLTAILLASLLFSTAHYVGPMGDPFTLGSFLFRFVAGLLFTGLYYLRGFAVTAYSHALYDIRVILF